MLTPQQLLTTTDKPTSTAKEKLIIIPITSCTATPNQNNIITSSDGSKR